MQLQRASELEGRTFSKDDENGALGELSRFVTPKDFEGNKYHILSWFRSNEFFDFVVLNIDDFDQNAISISLRIDNEEAKSCLKDKVIENRKILAKPSKERS